MKTNLILPLIIFLLGCNYQSKNNENLFTKRIVDIPMRDGINLHTIIYKPKMRNSEKLPILLNRTCYSIAPYEENIFPKKIGPSRFTMRDKYIVVYQDVRGRYMSEGKFKNMRPQISSENNLKIDESTDTFDTIEWLINNIEGNNGKVGMWGISYPGFYTTVGAVSKHPALIASIPQAPIADFYFDDFHHMGAFTLAYWKVFPVFGVQKDGRLKQSWYGKIPEIKGDMYNFFLNKRTLKNIFSIYQDNELWKNIVSHPNYDDFWQQRNILPHLRNITHNVLVVGGLFDAEDLYGPWSIYKVMEKYNPNANIKLVMGPWTHGDWAREKPTQKIGDIEFGDSLNIFYQEKIEAHYFSSYLKENKRDNLSEITIFDTGRKMWRSFNKWLPNNTDSITFYLSPKGVLDTIPIKSTDNYNSFVSDPLNPVPYTKTKNIGFTPRYYITEDQRFIANRDDVLTYVSSPLEKDMSLVGMGRANLIVSSSKEDADWVVKLIDVHPDNEQIENNINWAGYQQLVRGEILRGRYRNSFESPEPFIPNSPTKVNIPLQDIFHTFKKDHRIMIQIQSTWFPLFDLNPQNWVDNIYFADEEDFTSAIHKVYGGSKFVIGNMSK